MEIFQLSISGETHLKRLKRLEISMGNSNLLSRKGHRGLIFPGKFLETQNFKWARFPKEFPEMCANANPLPQLCARQVLGDNLQKQTGRARRPR